MNYEIRSKKAFCKKKSPSIRQDPSWSLELFEDNDLLAHELCAFLADKEHALRLLA
jgi:hypothetical protein